MANLHFVERAYDMILGLEERNVYAVDFFSNVTDYIMGKIPPLS